MTIRALTLAWPPADRAASAAGARRARRVAPRGASPRSGTGHSAAESRRLRPPGSARPSEPVNKLLYIIFTKIYLTPLFKSAIENSDRP